MSAKKDIRRSEREPFNHRTIISWSDSQGNSLGISGTCKDVAKGGMRVMVRDAPPMGTYVQFRVEGVDFAGSAAVRSVRRVATGYEVGLQFAGGLQWKLKGRQ